MQKRLFWLVVLLALAFPFAVMAPVARVDQRVGRLVVGARVRDVGVEAPWLAGPAGVEQQVVVRR